MLETERSGQSQGHRLREKERGAWTCEGVGVLRTLGSLVELLCRVSMRGDKTRVICRDLMMSSGLCRILPHG